MFGVEEKHAPKLDEILKEHKMTPDEKVSKHYLITSKYLTKIERLIRGKN